MGRDWWSGFGVGGDRLWVAPLVTLWLVAVGRATNVDGDLRSGMFPWLMGAAAATLALLGLRLIAVHGPDAGAAVLFGGWWATLAFLGIAGFFAGVAVGAQVGIDEEEAGALAVVPMISMAFGLLSMTPATALLAFGAGRAGVRNETRPPRWLRPAARILSAAFQAQARRAVDGARRYLSRS